MNFIATDSERSAIYGLGKNAQEAAADAVKNCGQQDGKFICLPCSEVLAKKVMERGGNIAWNERNGVAECEEEIY